MINERNDNLAEIVIGATIDDFEKSLSDANDAAWDHATKIAKGLGISLGSDEFSNLYRELGVRYEGDADHLKFFILLALLTVRDLLHSQALVLPKDKLYEEDVLRYVSIAARLLVNTYSRFSAGKGIDWPKNSDLPDDLNVSFLFPKTMILDKDIE